MIPGATKGAIESCIASPTDQPNSIYFLESAKRQATGRVFRLDFVVWRMRQDALSMQASIARRTNLVEGPILKFSAPGASIPK